MTHSQRLIRISGVLFRLALPLIALSVSGKAKNGLSVFLPTSFFYVHDQASGPTHNFQCPAYRAKIDHAVTALWAEKWPLFFCPTFLFPQTSLLLKRGIDAGARVDY